MNVSPIAAVVAALQAEVVALMDRDLTALGEIVSAAPAAESTPGSSPHAPSGSPPGSVAQAVVAALAAAAGRQGSLAPLMADLAEAQASPALPAPVKAAIVQVLALATPLAGPLTAQVVARAVAQSGLFLEAHLAAEGQAVAPDLKAALLTLQRALTPPPPPAQPAATRPAIAQPPATPSSVSAGGAPAPAQAASTQAPTPQASSSSAPKALTPQPSTVQTSTSPPTASTAGAAAPATADLKTALAAVRDALSAPSGETAALPAPLKAAISQLLAPSLAAPVIQASVEPPAELGPLLAAWLEGAEDETAAPEVKAALAALQQALPTPADETPAPPPRPTPPSPPSRDAAMAGQAAARSSLPEHADAQTITQVLARGVDQALARQTLHQLASLPEGPGQTWMFELPLGTPQGTAIAQFEIGHDGGAGGAQGQSGWRVRFSIDIEPLGPVHVQLAAGAERAAVTVWAERPEGYLRLRSLGDELARALPADVRFQSGVPRPPASTPGKFVDQST